MINKVVSRGYCKRKLWCFFKSCYLWSKRL